MNGFLKSVVVRRILHAAALLALAFAALGSPQPARADATIYFVAPSAAGTADCSSFTNACTLQSALGSAASGDEVWVKAGVYIPGSNVLDSFSIPSGVSVYGGFAGTEGTSDFGLRDPATNLTVLSGDMDGDDVNKVNGVTPSTADIRSTNSNHVVTPASGSVLDGLTITAGGAGGYGAAIFQQNSYVFTVSNVHIVGNQPPAVYIGGAASFTDVTLTNNAQSGIDGGAVHVLPGASPTFTDVTFDGNGGGRGGAVYNEGGSPAFANVTFYNNSASGTGGGAVYNYANGVTIDPTFTNVTFNQNHASSGSGGAVYNEAINSATLVGHYSNVILWGDTASSASEMYSTPSSPTQPQPVVSFSVIPGGCATITTSNSGAFCALSYSGDPMLGSLQDNGGLTETIALGAGSSALETGYDAACNAAPVNSLDQRGVTRPNGPHCDIGAYEYEHLFADVPVAGKEWMEWWIDAFYNAGITTGCGTNPLIYCPNNSTTRAAMAVFILRAIHGVNYTPPAATGIFADVPVAGKEWMQPWIEEFYNEGITTGCGVAPLIYCPENATTRAAMAVFIDRAFGLYP